MLLNISSISLPGILSLAIEFTVKMYSEMNGNDADAAYFVFRCLWY